MMWKREIRIGLKATFILLQIATALAGVCTAIVLLPLYFRISRFIAFRFRSLCPTLLACALSVTTGSVGYASLARKKKMYFFLFVLSLASLMNLEIVIALQSNRLADNNTKWLSSGWEGLSAAQREYIQEHMKCCASLEKCKYGKDCLAKFQDMTMAMRGASEKFLIALFFMETLSLSVLSFLKFGR